MKKLLKELAGLNNLEARVFQVLKEEGMRSDEVASKVNRDASTVNRALNTLLKVGLVSRESKCCDKKKGRYFIYSVSPNFKEVLENRFQNYCQAMRKELEGL